MELQPIGAARAIALQLEADDDLIATLRAALRDEGGRVGWVRAVGTLRTIELVGLAPRRRVDLVQLSGRLDLEVGATLYAVIADRGELVGGRVVGAIADRVEARIDLEEEAPAERSLVSARDDSEDDSDILPARSTSSAPARPVSWAQVVAASAADATPRGLRDRSELTAPSTAPSAIADSRAAPPPAPARATWADAVVASASQEESALGRDAAAEFLPMRGDFIHHRQFGLCRVDREEGNGNVVLRLPSGVRKKIALAFMDVGAPRMQGDKRVFAIRPRKG